VITLNDGTRIGEDVSAVLGTAGNPMSRDQVISKRRDLMVPVLGTAATAKLIERPRSCSQMVGADQSDE
jgi:hypothetical protein